MQKDGETDYTPPVEDNLLGLFDQDLINLYEASGIAKAEIRLHGMDETAQFDVGLILEIHRTAFGELYDWAGKWRNIEVQVGKLTPPAPSKIPFLMYQYADDVNFKLNNVEGKNEVAELFAYLHHRFVWIHPFNNGNGRTARLVLNFAALYKGFQPIKLYQRKGPARKTYIEALRKADGGDLGALRDLIFNELSPG